MTDELPHVDADADQPMLSLAPEPLRPEVSDEQVRQLPGFQRAITYMIDGSGLTDFEVACALGIDKGHMSRVRHGSAHFPTDKILGCMQLCESDIPLRWLAIHWGVDPRSFRRYENDLERELRETREQLDAERAERQAWLKLLREVGVKT